MRYIVTINYQIINPSSPLFLSIRTVNRAYYDVSGPSATAQARKNFMGSRNENHVKIVSTDVRDSLGRYAY
jgi:hypothetical protein